MKKNSVYHLIVSIDDVAEIPTESSVIKNSYHEKLLGVKIDNKLKFEGRAKSLCKKASSKLNTRAKTTLY